MILALVPAFMLLLVALDLAVTAVLRARCAWAGHHWFIRYERVGRVACCDRCEAVVVTPR